MWLDHTTKISNKRLLLNSTSSSSQCISAFFSNFAGIIYTGRPNSWRKHGEGRFRTFELIGPEEVVQTGISFGSQGHSRSLRMVLFDSRQNFLYFSLWGMCLSRVVLSLRRKKTKLQKTKIGCYGNVP